MPLLKTWVSRLTCVQITVASTEKIWQNESHLGLQFAISIIVSTLKKCFDVIQCHLSIISIIILQSILYANLYYWNTNTAAGTTPKQKNVIEFLYKLYKRQLSHKCSSIIQCLAVNNYCYHKKIIIKYGVVEKKTGKPRQVLKVTKIIYRSRTTGTIYINITGDLFFTKLSRYFKQLKTYKILNNMKWHQWFCTQVI